MRQGTSHAACCDIPMHMAGMGQMWLPTIWQVTFLCGSALHMASLKYVQGFQWHCSRLRGIEISPYGKLARFGYWLAIERETIRWSGISLLLYHPVAMWAHYQHIYQLTCRSIYLINNALLGKEKDENPGPRFALVFQSCVAVIMRLSTFQDLSLRS